MIFAAQYPTNVWDGTNQKGSRPLGNTCDRVPDTDDWDQISAEVKAVQSDLSGNLSGFHVGKLVTGSVLGGVPVLFPITITDAAVSTTVVVTDKIQVIDCWFQKQTSNGGSGDTIQVLNGASAITDAMSANKVVGLVTRLASIVAAQAVISAGGSLVVTGSKSTSVAAIVWVLAIKVP